MENLSEKKPGKKKKRKIDLVVISDVHLGTYGCHARELVKYMNSIKPKTVILNGDFIDMWQFSKHYWPKAHMKVIHKLTKWLSKGVKIYYITGNHDEMLRKFNGFKMGSLTITNKLVMMLDGKIAWIFHGDVFDVSMKHAKWLAKLGSTGYDLLILVNAFCNWVLSKLGRDKISFSKKIKNSIKGAVKHINNFETLCANIAIDKGYDYVLCGHIHTPEIKTITTEKGSVQYLNSGDWIENLSSLEYHNGEWTLFKYDKNSFQDEENDPDGKLIEMDNSELFSHLVNEFGKI